MKKRILSAVLVSGVTLGTAAVTVNADDFDSKIAATDSVINTLSGQQAAAQNQVTAIKGQVGALESQQSELEAQNAQLEAVSQQLGQEIQTLSNKIVARNESLKKQVRSAQKGNLTNYINTILNSKSVSDAVNRVVAIREVVSANEKMLAQQEADKAALEAKQIENQNAINTVAANKQAIENNKAALATQRAQLEAAQLELSAQLTTVQNEKASLIQAKAQAEEAARKAAEAQAVAEAKAQAESVAKAQAAAQVESATAPTETVQTQPRTEIKPSNLTATSSATTVAKTTATNEPKVTQPSVVTKAVEAPKAVVSSTPRAVSKPVVRSYDSSNTYPMGQCTWGAKSMASWVGNYWGNANQWGASARAAGYSVGTTPRVGAVAVWPYDGGGYGHVAVVTSVANNSSIQVMESNYAGNMSIGNYRGSFNPSASGSVYYIYPN
ncbi:TPA: peptidoglycan hydrolase PcsB [Streptococcus agalactiae]|uniref:Secreted antigen GbpB/SagA/PcsB, putative peptidoglycan hydrolase n=1 Tax=Streptococcus agalactiae TaxID=1311 RepID=A0AB38VMQ3_STRAG|nr:CHAP domain-containing protein [Streptococcus agalactiae]AWZ37139.1 CHAP domain-containing protein [Streptococcus agalactiae]SUN25316.1 Secreted antigen GbpB/SagA/PcsB, putative peptidoglycan hydrolase [Streptococcus agalactiae]VED64718.1 Secreted antigen GbpB/SagA/PcsB, putative peptidoglycan hydrolase [Streptococcus agalactiae]HEO8008932.1 CHAP domain-containing protein [Streptococcus agalactiae]